MAAPLIVADQLSHTYGSNHLFDDATFQVMPGDMVALVGPNGAGKSTRLRFLVGRERPDHVTLQCQQVRAQWLEQHPVIPPRAAISAPSPTDTDNCFRAFFKQEQPRGAQMKLNHAMPRTCPVCGSTVDNCSFCLEPAHHFIEANVGLEHTENRADATVYVCEGHEEMLSQGFHDGSLPEGVFVEIGMYTPNPGCPGCDSWR